jgi:hypothetical protein
MKNYYKYAFLLFTTSVTIIGCREQGCIDQTATNYNEDAKKDDGTCTYSSPSDYTGTGSITQGLATTQTANLLSCSNGRTAGIGTIADDSGTTWTVPASVNYTDASFPFASEMHNACSGTEFTTSAAAVASLDAANIVEIDATGEIITAYVFADNYFEMYINGIPVGKDRVPFTQFNASIIQFKVNRPFTIAMKLVDWEENLGLGSEDNQGFAYHAGDGGMVAVFKDATNATLAITNSSWRAQTYYTAPIVDLTCPTELGTTRSSSSCSTEGTDSGSNYYAIHWLVPTDWMNTSYDDAAWPAATEFTNSTIGVDNKASYTNFTDIFDASGSDASFIWSTNVVLDNLVLVRHTVN